MIGSFICPLNKVAWFKLSNLHPSCLPTLIVRNDSNQPVTWEVESSPTKGGALTSLMSPVTTQPGSMSKTDVPKVPAGSSPVSYLWCKLTITSSGSGQASMSLHAPPVS